MSYSAYSARVCEHYVMKPIAEKIEENVTANIGASVWRFSLKHTNKHLLLPDYIYAVNASMDDVPTFSHPLVLDMVKLGEAAFFKKQDRAFNNIYIDVRPFTTTERDGSVTITNEAEFELAALRAGLQHFVLKNTMADLLSLGVFPLTVFIRWLTQAISQKLGLVNPQDKQRLSVICGAYYYCLFAETGGHGDSIANLPERDKIKIASAIARATFISAEDAFAILDELPMMMDLQSFVNTLVTKGNSSRYQDLKVGVLIQIVGNSWFGFNSREVADVALEHPPTFFALVYSALKAKTFSKTILSTIVQEAVRGDNASSWTKALVSLPGLMWEIKVND